MQIIEQIHERFSVVDALDALGVDHGGKTRIQCPIHRGGGLNFGIIDNGNAFKCFSHDCGNGSMRSGINLYSLVTYSQTYKNLDSNNKSRLINDLCLLTGLENTKQDKKQNGLEFLLKGLDVYEKKVFGLMLKCSSSFTWYSPLMNSRKAQRISLFFAIADSMGKLPMHPLKKECFNFVVELENYLRS